MLRLAEKILAETERAGRGYLAFLLGLLAVCAVSRPTLAEEPGSAKTVKVAGIVLKWVRGDKDANLRRIEPLIREAAKNGAKIVCTSECFLDGYAIADKTIPLETYRNLGEPIPSGPYFKRLAGLAKELKIHLVAGLLEADGEARYNTAVLLGPGGKLIGKYRKQKLGHETVRNTAGDKSPVFETPFGKIGLMICADRTDPEIVRRFRVNGADFLLCPSGGMFGPKSNDPILQARSRENKVPIVFVHPAEFLATGPDGSVQDRALLGDVLLVTPEQVGGDKDLKRVVYFKLAAIKKAGPKESTGLVALTDMTAKDRYKGEDGGLYGQGKNQPPEAHRKAAAAELAKIQPLDAAGKPAKDGKIGFVSISMSNATQEFSTFKRLADADAAKSPVLTIVDCAQGGQAMAEWADPNARPWTEADRRLSAAKVSPQQVQAAWIKLANKGPRGDLEQHGKKLQRDTLAVVHNAKARFPNLRIAYLSSRIYGGHATSPLNPEPYAYESAFVVRWLIRDQIKGDTDLNYDAGRGAVKAPVLLWGPYLWADGATPRKTDGLIWKRDDLAGDGTHPSQVGREKVAKLLLEFFKGDPLAKSWFAAGENK